MEGLFANVYEDNVDARMPEFKEVSVAMAVYLWLYSRAFSIGNHIRIRKRRLSEKIGCDEKTVRFAIKRLKNAGLIAATSSARGSEFSIIGMPSFEEHLRQFSSGENTRTRKTNAAYERGRGRPVSAGKSAHQHR